jgi:hypothetical protein
VVAYPIHVHKFYYNAKILDLRNYGYKLISIVGYIYPPGTPEAARPGTVPLQEFFNPLEGVYVYTIIPQTDYSWPGPLFYPAGDVGYVFNHRQIGALEIRT